MPPKKTIRAGTSLPTRQSARTRGAPAPPLRVDVPKVISRNKSTKVVTDPVVATKVITDPVVASQEKECQHPISHQNEGEDEVVDFQNLPTENTNVAVMGNTSSFAAAASSTQGALTILEEEMSETEFEDSPKPRQPGLKTTGESDSDSVTTLGDNINLRKYKGSKKSYNLLESDSEEYLSTKSDSEDDDDGDPDFKPKNKDSDSDAHILGDEIDSDDDIDDEEVVNAVVVDDDDFFTSREFNRAIEFMEGNNSKKPEKKGKGVRGNVIAGGPVKPDTTHMTEDEATDALREYAKERKSYTDKQRSERRKKGNLLATVVFSGDDSPSLRLESIVENRRLIVGDSFAEKVVLRMRVMEEANLRGISVKTVRSDNYTLKVKGERFFVLASYSEKKGWVVKHAMVRDNDPLPQLDAGELEDADNDDNNALPRTPFTSKWLVPLIHAAVEEKPNITNADLRRILLPYGKPYALTRAVLQEARKLARNELFGDPK